MTCPSFHHLPLDQSWDAIVVGSGIGGLATAALLSRYAGKKVLVLERHYIAGGYTHVFHRPGYEWDVGLHYVGQVQDETSVVRKAFDQITNGQLQWEPMPDVYDRFVIGDQVYEFVSGVDRFRDRLHDYFPGESVAIDQYLKALQSAAQASDLYFAEKAIPRPIAFLLGELMRAPLMRWARRTTAEVLAGFTRNRELIGLLTAQWGDYGLPPGQSSFGLHGQDVTSLGVTGALFGGVLTASAILRRNLMETIAKEGNVRKRKTKQEIIYRGCKAQELTEQTSTQKAQRSTQLTAPSDAHPTEAPLAADWRFPR